MIVKKYIFLVPFVFFTSPIKAQVSEYVRDYSYHATKFDSEYTSRINAVEGVKTTLLDEIGTYIQSVVLMKEDSNGGNYFSKDTVALTAGILSMKLLKENWDYKKYYVKASMKADPDDVKKAVDEFKNNYKLEITLRDSLRGLSEAKNTIENLKKELKENQDSIKSLQLAKSYFNATQNIDAEEKFKGIINSKIYGGFDDAFFALTKLAKEGNATAQLRLGFMYERGMYVEQDYVKAREWYNKSIKSGSAKAIAQLGFLYERGMGLTKDLDKAIFLYNDAIAKGSPYANSKLAYLYQTAQGVERDYEKSYQLYKKASHAGSPFALARIGHFYQRGIVVDKDLPKAIEFYEKAAKSKQPLAMALLGFAYIKGWGVDEDFDKAKQLIKESVRYKNPQGLSYMGYIYENGFGEDQDDDIAVDYYKKSVEMGSTFGEFRLGFMYLKGRGVERDVDEALSYLKKAADKGHLKAKEIYDRVSSRF